MSNLLDRRFLGISLSVLAVANQPDDNSSAGTQYIVGSSPAGVFSGATVNSIARFDGTAWSFTTPKVGELEVLNLQTSEILKFDGAAWTAAASLGGETSFIPVVDKIIYGIIDVENNICVPDTLKELRGRLYQVNEYNKYLAALNHFSGQYSGSAACDYTYTKAGRGIFAGFFDGKIHTYANEEFSSVVLHDGDFIFCKEDNSLYSYDAANHKFLKISGHNHFIVDQIVDYVGDSLPETLNVDGVCYVDISENSNCELHYLIAGSTSNENEDRLYDKNLGELNNGFCFAGIQSTLNDEACIYSTIVDEKYGIVGVYTVSELANGDTVFSKFDGCLYTFVDDGTNKAFVKSSADSLLHVSEIIPFNHGGGMVANVGERLVEYNLSNSGPRKVFTATAQSSWDNGVELTDGACYADSNAHRIYKYHREELVPLKLNPKTVFFNEDDNTFYLYNLTSFTALGQSGSSSAAAEYLPVKPVLAIVPTGTTLPATASAGDVFVNTGGAKLYTAVAANLWDSGNSIAAGTRYASSTDFKIYSSNGFSSPMVEETILGGDMFLNKEDGAIYVYDSTVPAFVRILGVKSETVTEVHTLTAAEVTAKGFSLTNSVATGKENNILLFVSGIAQAVGTDFTVSGNSISWNNKGLASLGLAAGDTFILHYTVNA